MPSVVGLIVVAPFFKTRLAAFDAFTNQETTFVSKNLKENGLNEITELQ
jgi:hypothetical protein